MSELLQRLKDGVPFFKDWSDEALVGLLRTAERKPFHAEEMLIAYGAGLNQLWVILAGTLTAGRTHIGPGEVLFETSVAERQEVRDDVFAASDGLALVLKSPKYVPYPPPTEIALWRTLTVRLLQEANRVSEERQGMLRGDLLLGQILTVALKNPMPPGALQNALALQKKAEANGESLPLGQILVDLGLVKPQDVKRALSLQKAMREHAGAAAALLNSIAPPGDGET